MDLAGNEAAEEQCCECVTLESQTSCEGSTATFTAAINRPEEDPVVQLECVGWMEPPLLLKQSQAGIQTPQIGSSPISESRTPPGSSGSGYPMRSREASPWDAADAEGVENAPEERRQEGDPSPKSTLVVSPPLQLKSLEVEGTFSAKNGTGPEDYFIGTPPVSAELRPFLDGKGVKEVSQSDSLSNTGSSFAGDRRTDRPPMTDWLSSPRDALPPRQQPRARPDMTSTVDPPTAQRSVSGADGRRQGSAGIQRPRRRPGEEPQVKAKTPTPSRTPSAAALRAGRKVSRSPERGRGEAPPLRPSRSFAGHKAVEATQQEPTQAPTSGVTGGALWKRPKPKATSKWAWKDNDIRSDPSSPRRRPEAKVRAAPGVPSARVAAALDGPQGLMSLLSRLSPREPPPVLCPREALRSAHSTPLAPKPPVFTGCSGEDFKPGDWATHLRRGRPASPPRSKSQGGLRRAWSPVGAATSPPRWQPLAHALEPKGGSPRLPPPPMRLMAGPERQK